MFALVPELEAWQESADAKRAMRDAGAVNGALDPPMPAAAPQPAGAAPAVDARQAGPRSRRIPRGVLIVIVGVAVLIVFAFLLTRYLQPAPPGQPSSARIVDKALAVYDADGRFLWKQTFEFPLTEALYDTRLALDNGLTPIVIDDIDADGNMEVLFVSEPWRQESRGLYCFDRLGKIRFQRTPDRNLRYGDLQAGPPWRGVFVLAIGDTGRPHDIWFVSTHLIEFPTVVEKLDAAGNLKGEYWSNGQIYGVATAEVGGRPLVFVGATSNEFKGGSLAVLDARQPTGAAPAASDHYRCDGCPQGTPLAFLEFPRLDVVELAGGYASVTSVFVDAAGDISVDVRQPPYDLLLPELATLATSLYRLDAQFRVKSAELGGRFASVHRALEERGLLDHPFSVERDSRKLWPVLRWNGTSFDEIRGPEK